MIGIKYFQGQAREIILYILTQSATAFKYTVDIICQYFAVAAITDIVTLTERIAI